MWRGGVLYLSRTEDPDGPLEKPTFNMFQSLHVPTLWQSRNKSKVIGEANPLFCSVAIETCKLPSMHSFIDVSIDLGGFPSISAKCLIPPEVLLRRCRFQAGIIIVIIRRSKKKKKKREKKNRFRPIPLCHRPVETLLASPAFQSLVCGVLGSLQKENTYQPTKHGHAYPALPLHIVIVLLQDKFLMLLLYNWNIVILQSSLFSSNAVTRSWLAPRVYSRHNVIGWLSRYVPRKYMAFDWKKYTRYYLHVNLYRRICRHIDKRNSSIATNS